MSLGPNDRSGERHAVPDPVAALVRSATPGLEPDAARMERALHRVHGEWHAALAERRRARRRPLFLAAAAAVLIAISVGLLWPEAPVSVATVDRVIGDVVVRSVEHGELRVTPSHTAHAILNGEEIDTGSAGRALLTLRSGEQLRIDSGTLIGWTSPAELRLTRGTVYIETATNARSPAAIPVSIVTPLGSVRHVGTRFEVQVSNGGARVRVRDGSVIYSRQGEAPITLSIGQQLSVTTTSSALEAGPGSADASWEWTRGIAPEFAIEGRSLYDALEWLGHESGLRVVYADERASSQAHGVILRGSIEGLDTSAALRAVLVGGDLQFELRPDRIDIRASRSE
jgi:ferric-dicitrate binding protein FerR (iron transport regulator)